MRQLLTVEAEAVATTLPRSGNRTRKRRTAVSGPIRASSMWIKQTEKTAFCGEGAN